jgi:hypothetical protein
MLMLALSACHGATEPSGTRVELQNVVDPDSVNAVSLFNSCVGHAFPQPNSPNSAKNYFWPNSTNFSTNDQLRILAACAGTVRQNSSDTSPDQQDRGRTVHLFCDGSSTSLRYFHLNFASSLLGQHVNAGGMMGYAAMVGTGQVPPPNPAWYFSSNFDIAVMNDGDSQTENYFARLSPAAFAAWNARGITSVSQTANASNQNCSSYNSDISNPGILVFSPTR